jgi:hypothetical protein
VPNEVRARDHEIASVLKIDHAHLTLHATGRLAEDARHNVRHLTHREGVIDMQIMGKTALSSR